MKVKNRIFAIPIAAPAISVIPAKPKIAVVWPLAVGLSLPPWVCVQLTEITEKRSGNAERTEVVVNENAHIIEFGQAPRAIRQNRLSA
jgi:hypothetical protein